MPKRVLQGGSVARFEEYEVRTIDEHGDAQNCNHYETRREALREFERVVLDEEVHAVVVEYHVCYSPARFGKETYKTIARRGSASALAAGGWDTDEQDREEA